MYIFYRGNSHQLTVSICVTAMYLRIVYVFFLYIKCIFVKQCEGSKSIVFILEQRRVVMKISFDGWYSMTGIKQVI